MCTHHGWMDEEGGGTPRANQANYGSSVVRLCVSQASSSFTSHKSRTCESRCFNLSAFLETVDGGQLWLGVSCSFDELWEVHQSWLYLNRWSSSTIWNSWTQGWEGVASSCSCRSTWSLTQFWPPKLWSRSGTHLLQARQVRWYQEWGQLKLPVS